jgi:ribonuclease Z
MPVDVPSRNDLPHLKILVQLALDANVRQLVIGHFSARYEDESVLLHEASAIFPQTILAKENLCIDVDGGTVYEK